MPTHWFRFRVAAPTVLLSACALAAPAGTAWDVQPRPAGDAHQATTAHPRHTRFLQPTGTITPAKGCVVLTPGMNGIKVRLVQRRLGMGSRWETMDAATVAAVKAFQTNHSLRRRNGVVGARTWRAMGFQEGFCFDRWQATPALPRRAGSAKRIRVMLAFANRYRGAEYVWGGAGRPRYGVDCSGLVLQSLYRAGLDPQPVSIDKHVLPDYRTSSELYHHPRLRHVPRAHMRRGDLIFYTKNSTGQINHVALYLGGDLMLEAKGEDVHVADVATHFPDQTIASDVVRPFR